MRWEMPHHEIGKAKANGKQRVYRTTVGARRPSRQWRLLRTFGYRVEPEHRPGPHVDP
jgi:hypothetical protein